MNVNHDRIVTPTSDPERWHEEEEALFNAGKCSWQTAFGMPWIEYCGHLYPAGMPRFSLWTSWPSLLK